MTNEMDWGGFVAGEVVRLRNGSHINMTINMLKFNGALEVVWFDGEDHLHYAELRHEVLELVPEDEVL